MYHSQVEGSTELAGCVPPRAQTEYEALQQARRIEEAAEQAFSRVLGDAWPDRAADSWSVGVQLGQGLPVTAVMKGSPAESAGLQEGDIILKANGWKTPTLADFDCEKVIVRPGGELLLTVYREGCVIELKVLRRVD